MKKIFVLALMALFCIGASAGEDEKSKKTTWYVKLGGVSCSLTDFDAGDYELAETSSKLGYVVGIAFDRSIGSKGWFWGAGLQLRSKGGKTHYYTHKDMNDDNGGLGGSYTDTWNIDDTYNINTLEIPLSFGYKWRITDDWAVDFRVGGFFNYDISGNMKEKIYGWYDGKEYSYDETETKIGDLDCDKYSAGALAGIGVWYKKFNINLTYELGLMEQFEGGGKEKNLLFTVGYAL